MPWIESTLFNHIDIYQNESRYRYLFARPRYEISGNSHGNFGQHTRHVLIRKPPPTSLLSFLSPEKKLFSAYMYTCSWDIKTQAPGAATLKDNVPHARGGLQMPGSAPENMQKRAEHEPLKENEGKLSKLLAVRACRWHFSI